MLFRSPYLPIFTERVFAADSGATQCVQLMEKLVILGLTIRCLLRIVKLRFLEAEELQCAEAVLMSMNNTDIMIAGRFILNVAKGVMMFVPWIYLKTKGKMQLK